MIITERQYVTRCNNEGCCRKARYEIAIANKEISLCNRCLVTLAKISLHTVIENIEKEVKECNN